MATNICRKTNEDLFGGDTKKDLKYSLWENNFRQKSHNNFSGKFGNIWAKILRTPKNLLAPVPAVVLYAEMSHTLVF